MPQLGIAKLGDYLRGLFGGGLQGPLRAAFLLRAIKYR